MRNKRQRCSWVIAGNKLYESYHDHHWGKPIFDDKKLFEYLSLEGAQAGLSWLTILKKRKGYLRVFKTFDPEKVSQFSEKKIQQLLMCPDIIRHEGKIRSVIQNAKAILSIQKEFGSFSSFLWKYVNGKTIKNHFLSLEQVPSKTTLSVKISKDLKKRGFCFVGPKVIYSFLQAAGLIDDHLVSCFCHQRITWYVYMIRCDQGSLYTGITNDLGRRFEEHKLRKKGAKFFRSCDAIKIEYFETYPSRSEALKREWAIKKMQKKEKELLVQKGTINSTDRIEKNSLPLPHSPLH